METIEETELESRLMNICQLEREAETLYINKDSTKAREKIQELMDKYINPDQKELRGWYLQTIARYQWWFNQKESNRLQITAHKNNSFLFKPVEGMQMSKLDAIDLTRIKNIQDWIKKFPTYEELINEVNDILTRLAFGVDSDKFEEAIDELGKSMGFLCQRPDKEWKQGPDNLWKIRSGYYLVIECKNQVDRDRKIISKQEVGQMNISCTWFKENYAEADFLPVMIIPTNKVAKSTPFSDDVKVMCQGQLTKLVQSVRGFFISLKEFDLNQVTEEKIEELIRFNSLSIDNIISMYVQNPYRKDC